MERESFENEEVAKLLNKNFVSIKVDREEYPQIDRYYQFVYQILNKRGGGWPLTIILTPDKEPFFAGTYIPRESKMGQSGLKDILTQVVGEWKSNPKRVKEIAHQIKLYADHLKYNSLKSTPKRPDENISKVFVNELKSSFDDRFKGWGKGVKFPQAQRITTLLDIYMLTKDENALDMAIQTLKAMALSGIYDQIEGGFFRYSTDRRWKIPHFEKMLYTNAELIEAYSKAWIITKEPLFKKVVEDTIKNFVEKYRDTSGLFYGASDADSIDTQSGKKEEGFYFTYNFDEIKKFLESKSIDDSLITQGLKHYGITKDGNFINYKSHTSIADHRGSFKIIKNALQKIRESRVYPFIDKKMQSSWNALMIHSLFVASKIDSNYSKLALSTLDALLKKLYKDGVLYHQILPKKSPKITGGLEDYVFVTEALIDAYEATFDKKYLKLAKELQKTTRSLFLDKKENLWIDSINKISNPINIEDNSYKSPLATIVSNYLRLGILLEELSYNQLAREILFNFFGEIKSYSGSSASAVRVSLAYIYGYILLKGDYDKLNSLKAKLLDEILYPYIHYKVDSSNYLQACKIDRCFLHEKSLNDFLHKLSSKYLAPYQRKR
jgi:uncharacterized protein YyaL (SSP411 family)